MTEEQFRQRIYNLALTQLGPLFAEMQGRTGHPFVFQVQIADDLERFICTKVAKLINEVRVEPTNGIHEAISGNTKTQSARAAIQHEMTSHMQSRGLVRVPTSTDPQDQP